MGKTPKELGFVYDEGGMDRWTLFKAVEVGKDYADALLNDCCILECELIGFSFCSAQCRSAAFFCNDFDLCDFRNADLTGADLRGSRFKRCCFDNTNLENAELRSADFVACSFDGASVRGARVGYLQSLLLEWSKEQRRDARRSLLGWIPVKGPPGA